MTSRERVRRAIDHREPDRVPIDVGGSKNTGIHADAYADLARFLGLDLGPPVVYEQFLMLARMDEQVRCRLYGDVVELENPCESWGLENRDWKPWRTGRNNIVLMPGQFNPISGGDGYAYLDDSHGKHVAYMPENGLYFERYCSTELSSGIERMDPETWRVSIPLYTDEQLRTLETEARRLHSETDYSIHGGFGKGSLGTNGIFAGHTISDWLCLLVTEEDYCYSILQATAERAVENLNLYLQAVGDMIDTILISGTDFGTQTQELFNPEIFRRLFVPTYRRINDFAHSHCHARTMFHSCGSIRNLIGYFIEAGVDILNPVQTGAANMNPSDLKKEFGDRIVFWGGGVDTQSTLPFGTEDQVREQVRERIAAFAPGGGYVFAATHDIQHGVPPRNIVAAMDAAREYGDYAHA